jgi:hypothetical protein
VNWIKTFKDLTVFNLSSLSCFCQLPGCLSMSRTGWLSSPAKSATRIWLFPFYDTVAYSETNCRGQTSWLTKKKKKKKKKNKVQLSCVGKAHYHWAPLSNRLSCLQAVQWAAASKLLWAIPYARVDLGDMAVFELFLPLTHIPRNNPNKTHWFTKIK